METLSFHTMDALYFQMLSGVVLSIASILFINFIVAKKKFSLPSFVPLFKSVDHVIHDDSKLVSIIPYMLIVISNNCLFTMILTTFHTVN